MGNTSQVTQDLWFQPLIWIDYRVAIIFMVIIPLGLLLWAFLQKTDPIRNLLIIYWRVASLILITLYLMIAGLPIGFFTSIISKLLIPLSLWFWVDLNEEINDLAARPLKLAFTSWRWAMTIYCSLGAIAFIPFLPCGFTEGMIKQPFCKSWLEVPNLYKNLIHQNSKPEFLGVIAIIGLVIYLLYFIYFLVVRLGKQGRTAMSNE